VSEGGLPCGVGRAISWVVRACASAWFGLRRGRACADVDSAAPMCARVPSCACVCADAFYNVLVHHLGYRRGTDIEVGCITYQRFTLKRDSYRPPLACRSSARGLELEREAEIMNAKRTHGCLFARKLAPSCDLACLVSSGFQSFQCSGRAPPPVEERPCVPADTTGGPFDGACRR
jgi:hypothetical protein